tara:strand:- start:218 stop:913 length:696 start_codon:yes stop_codon:yes gene_type:complete
MATSGTTTFDLSIDEIVQEAYNRCGVVTDSGYDLSRARRNLNILFSEWGNRGVHLWKVKLKEIALVAGTAEYSTATSVNDVLEAFVSSSSLSAQNSDTQDVSLVKIDRSAYAALPNKLQTGQPSQYFVDRQTTPKVFLYQAPDLTTYTHFKYYAIERIEDAGSYTNTADVAYRFIPCMVGGLAYYLSFMVNPTVTQNLKLAYEDELQRALDQDGQRTSVYLSPQTYFGDGV